MVNAGDFDRRISASVEDLSACRGEPNCVRCGGALEDSSPSDDDSDLPLRLVFSLLSRSVPALL